MVEIIELKCPGCGAPINRETTKCKYCHKEMIIKHDDLFCGHHHDDEHAEFETNYKGMNTPDKMMGLAANPVVNKSFLIFVLLTILLPGFGFQYLYRGDKKAFGVRIAVFILSMTEIKLFSMAFGLLFLFDLFRLFNGYFKKNAVDSVIL